MMWNPDIYRDTDYGLEDDDTFEPVDDIEDDFVPAEGEPYIQTVLGPIRLEEAGVALIHEHLQWDPAGDPQADTDNRINDLHATLLDLEAFFSASGRTIVSATPAVAGRRADGLLWLARHAPVHIVAVTGFHTQRYLESWYGVNAADAMRADIERDLNEGMDGTEARPGLIKVGTSEGIITDLERHSIELAAEAHRKHHLPVITHAEHGSMALEQVQLLSDLGVDASRVVVSHLDFIEDERQLRAIADSGVFMSFDQLGKPYRGPDQPKARRIARLVRDGYRDQILISHDFARRSLLTGYSGRPGLSYIVEQFAIMLLEEGLEALDVRAILVDNTARAMAVMPPGSVV